MRLIHLAQPLASIWGASRSTKHEPILPSWICRRVVSRFVTRRSSNFDGWIFRRCMLISSAETYLLNPFIGWIFRRFMLNVLRKKRRSTSLCSSYFKRALKLFQNQVICLFNQISNIFFFVFYSGTLAKSNLRYQKLGKTIEDKESMTLKENGAICLESLAPNSRSSFSCRKQLDTFGPGSRL